MVVFRLFVHCLFTVNNIYLYLILIKLLNCLIGFVWKQLFLIAVFVGFFFFKYVYYDLYCVLKTTKEVETLIGSLHVIRWAANCYRWYLKEFSSQCHYMYATYSFSAYNNFKMKELIGTFSVGGQFEVGLFPYRLCIKKIY